MVCAPKLSFTTFLKEESDFAQSCIMFSDEAFTGFEGKPYVPDYSFAM